jgi:hypothetical protein
MKIKRRIKTFSLPVQPGQSQVASSVQQPQQQQKSSSEEVTMRDLQLEQSRLQRQQTQIQHQKSQLLLKNEMTRRREIVQLQKLKKDEEDARIKNSIRVKKEEEKNNEEAKARSASLYKTKPRPVQPVGMPKSRVI